MSAEKKNGVPEDQLQAEGSSSRLIGVRSRRDTPDLRPGNRNLRRAVLLLAEKVESLGVDVSDVTELIGAKQDC